MLSSRGDSRKGLTTSAGAAMSNLGRGTLRKCLALVNMPELKQISLEEKKRWRYQVLTLFLFYSFHVGHSSHTDHS